MHLRYIKILIAFIAAAMCLVYVSQNLANLPAAHASLVYVMSAADHGVYTETFGFYSDSRLLAWVAVSIICSFEVLAGLALLYGSIMLWSARATDAETFARAGKWAEIGAAIGILVWFGFFGVIGSAFFQMWQTQVGTNSMNGAFQFFASCVFTLLVLYLPDRHMTT